MSNPKYSFVLSAYKADFLKEAIKSILSQTYRNFALLSRLEIVGFKKTRIA